MTRPSDHRRLGIPESALPGPYPVGLLRRAAARRLREFASVQLMGEVWGVPAGPGARVLRAARRAAARCRARCGATTSSALAIALARRDADRRRRRLRLLPRQRDLLPVVHVRGLRAAGRRRGRPARSQLERLRRRLAADGLFEPQKRLPRPLLPRTIGVVTGEQGKARDDVLAGLRRRGWGGRLVWAFAPVQDRHAAPAIAAALRELAAIEEVEVVIVARGGGSLADLFAFCDEALCRTVALLRVPVISSVGHHTDRTLIDDVAAVCCSTPTHAAEAAVPIDCRAARADVGPARGGCAGHGSRAIVERARALGAPVAGPAPARRPPPPPAASAHAGAARERPSGVRQGPARWPACTCWC